MQASRHRVRWRGISGIGDDRGQAECDYPIAGDIETAKMAIRPVCADLETVAAQQMQSIGTAYQPEPLQCDRLVEQLYASSLAKGLAQRTCSLAGAHRRLPKVKCQQQRDQGKQGSVHTGSLRRHGSGHKVF